MKQAKEESVNAYWVRVQNYFNKIVKDYTEKKNLNPVNDPNNVDYQKMTFLAEFMRDQMITKYFVGGLLPHLEREIAPRVSEIQERDPANGILLAAVEAERAAPTQKKDTGFQASSIAAVSIAGVSEDDLERMEPSVRQAIVAAFHGGDSSGRGRGRGGGRGRGAGRGGFGGRGGFQNSADKEHDARTVRSIQARSRARFCSNCKQWCKHQASECRHSRAEIAAMEPMDQAARPDKSEQVFDLLYDDKEAMPGNG